MLQNIRDFYDNTLAASDGQIGHVKDFYFDDKSWAIRYLIVDTGTWLSERKVLISPHAFGTINRESKLMQINLTKKQIEDCPQINTHRPVSRQYEQDYYNYYGWPAYWQGGGMWGIAGFPMVTDAAVKGNGPHHGHNQRDDIHLRSTQAITGYTIEAADGPMGTVTSLMVDDKTWGIIELVVETGHWYAGKEVRILPSKVERISYEEAKVYVYLTKVDIQFTDEDAIVKTHS